MVAVSARDGERGREYLHQAVVAGSAEAQDLPVPLHGRPGHLAVSSLLECSVLLLRSARARQQTDRVVVSLCSQFTPPDTSCVAVGRREP